MLSLSIKAKDLLHRTHTGEAAQDAFEYLLIVGAVSVVVIGALATLATDDPFGLIALINTAITNLLA